MRTDTELLSLSAGGSDRAFAELFDRHFSAAVTSACGSLWQSGMLGAVPESAVPGKPDAGPTPPPIAVCLGDGGAGVGFPIFDGSTPADVCAALGLEPFRG